MKAPNGDRSGSVTGKSTRPAEPSFPALSRLPSTPEELFASLALTAHAAADPKDRARRRVTSEYALPWVGFESWRDARVRLQHFEKHTKAAFSWRLFNDTAANDGPMSLNAYPGRALIERVTNGADACLEARASKNTGAMPTSPGEAVAKWFNLKQDALASGMTDAEQEDLAKSTVRVVGFVGDRKDERDSVFDTWDAGVGLSAAEMPSTILSLNRGNKKSKTWLTGKHGQGASSTYQYADLTLIASRKAESEMVAFTLVEARWEEESGFPAKTPTYRYLVIDGEVPEIRVPRDVFPVGTLVRHIGYNAVNLFDPLAENSLYGLLMRSLAEPLLPIWLELFSLRPGKGFHRGARRYGRVIRGTVNSLERAWAETMSAGPGGAAGEASPPDTRPEGEAPSPNEDGDALPSDVEEGSKRRLLHRASEYFQLPRWDYGARTGWGELGKVRITYWVADPGTRTSRNVLSNWVDPDKTILLTLDGQTHAEESRAIVTGKTGANLWAVGRYMVVQIDCNGLDPRARYELFTSTREHAKETPIKKMILEELVRRLNYDQKLKDLNTRMAAAEVKPPADGGQAIASLIRRYLKAAGVNFEQLTRKIEKWTDVEIEKPIVKPETPPIESVEPPTFIRWKFVGETLKMWPGQRHSAVFETDAAPAYWNPEDQSTSRIKVVSHGLRYGGAGEMKGGRVRCHFECPKEAVVGSKGNYIQVQLEYAPGTVLAKLLPVEIVEKPPKKPKPPPKPPVDDPPEPEDSDKFVKVKIRKRDFTEVDIPVVTPTPVTRADTLWATLGWPADPGRVGFSIRSLGGKIHLYYNAEFPPFLDLRHKMSRKSLEEEFVRRYEVKLVLHTIFTLNYDFVDEEEFREDQRKQVRSLLCATAESLALATKSELEIESRMKSDDAVPMENVMAGSIAAGAGGSSSEGAANEESARSPGSE